MRELEIWFERNNPKQMRVPLRSQIHFKTIEITYQSELRFLGIYITENLSCPCSIFNTL
jgi:hypothetical protein